MDDDWIAADPWSLPFLPDTCPRCGDAWNRSDFGFSPRKRIVNLVCRQGHETRFGVTIEELLEFEHTVLPWMADRPIHLEGGTHDGTVVTLPGPAPKLRTLTGETYVYRREDGNELIYVLQPPG